MADRYGATTVVCDNGSAFIKAAIVGGLEVTIMNVIGIRNPFFDLVRDPDPDPIYIIGEYATLNPGLPRKIHPIVRGKIVDFNAMRRVWRHVFMNRLGIDPSECNLIITVPARSDQDPRSQMVIMINEFNCRSILVATAPVLAFYSKYGNGVDANGIVVEIGDSLTQVVPIYEGLCMDRAAIKINEIGGRDITDKLVDLLTGNPIG